MEKKKKKKHSSLVRNNMLKGLPVLSVNPTVSIQRSLNYFISVCSYIEKCNK